MNQGHKVLEMPQDDELIAYVVKDGRPQDQPPGVPPQGQTPPPPPEGSVVIHPADQQHPYQSTQVGSQLPPMAPAPAQPAKPASTVQPCTVCGQLLETAGLQANTAINCPRCGASAIVKGSPDTPVRPVVATAPRPQPLVPTAPGLLVLGPGNQYRAGTDRSQFRFMTCPSCRKLITADGVPNGQQVRCPKCGLLGTVDTNSMTFNATPEAIRSRQNRQLFVVLAAIMIPMSLIFLLPVFILTALGIDAMFLLPYLLIPFVFMMIMLVLVFALTAYATKKRQQTNVIPVGPAVQQPPQL